MDRTPDFSELIETAERLLHERQQCQQTVAELRKARARDPLARAQTAQRLADATLRVNAINEAIRAAKEAFEQPDLLAEVLAKGRTLPGAKCLPLGTGLAKRHSLEGAKPLEIGPRGAPGELAKRATVKGARRIEIARPWGGW